MTDEQAARLIEQLQELNSNIDKLSWRVLIAAAVISGVIINVTWAIKGLK